MSEMGHSLPMHSAPVPINARYASDSDHFTSRLLARHGAVSPQCAPVPPMMTTMRPSGMLTIMI